MAILRADNISCGYGKKKVIKDISFFVEEGGFLGIIGPNGAGKTTLFRAITRILPIESGNISYNQQDIAKISARALSKEIAILPQFLDVPFSLSVEEFVAMGRFAYVGRFGGFQKKDIRCIERAMELTETISLRHRIISELSGGEKQCVYLAQAFAQEPNLLLLDEPTAHLDIAHQVRIMDIVRRMNKKEGLTVLVVLHDLNLASEYCSRLMLLKNGSIYKNGPASEVLTYQNIEAVYNTVVVVKENPINKKPCIFLVSEGEVSND